MDNPQQGLAALQDIKKMMERSSRFISLSGWSGIAAGLCALGGSVVAIQLIHGYAESARGGRVGHSITALTDLEGKLVVTAVVTFAAALLLSFLFTYLRSRKEGIPVWGSSAQRLMFNTTIPLMAGGFVGLRMLQQGLYGVIAPTCLIFYGLALVNGSKYTLGEVRYLGYCEILLGIISLWVPGYGVYFWALGFGVMHIIYGAVMWWKYEREK